VIKMKIKLIQTLPIKPGLDMVKGNIYDVRELPRGEGRSVDKVRYEYNHPAGETVGIYKHEAEKVE